MKNLHSSKQFECDLDNEIFVYQQSIKEHLSSVLLDTFWPKKFFEQQIHVEKDFYIYAKKILDDVICNNNDVILLFDIDETLVPYWKNDLRPSWKILMHYLQSTYPKTILWIVSARDRIWIQNFCNINPYFNAHYCYSARHTNDYIPDHIRDTYELRTTWSCQKFNFLLSLKERTGKNFFLIDDLLSSPMLYKDMIAFPFKKEHVCNEFTLDI